MRVKVQENNWSLPQILEPWWVSLIKIESGILLEQNKGKGSQKSNAGAICRPCLAAGHAGLSEGSPSSRFFSSLPLLSSAFLLLFNDLHPYHP